MDVRQQVTKVWKTSERKVIASLVRIVRDVGLAEDVAQEALMAALTDWPASGVPERPEAWLMTTAKRRAFNVLRHERVKAALAPVLAEEEARSTEAELEMGIDEDIADDVLKLLFMACHPSLPKDARVALTLRLVAGLSTSDIARAFLTTEPAIQQRIVRAKRALADARIPFELPRGAELGGRLESVLEVVYLVFNEGYYATAGDDVMRPALQDEALRLGLLLTELAPAEPETHGLLALMELTASRAAARTDANGDPVLLRDQDRTRWDSARIARGLQSLERAGELGGTRGPYQLQAAIAAVHARGTDWPAIVGLYDALLTLSPSPIVELNRAIAVSFADGPAAALALLDALVKEPALARYHLLPSARAEMLERLGRRTEARAEFVRAADLTDNARQRERLRRRAAALGD
ncbi:MAG: sigma-70 family RNA polymerase sigma factor [Labilithrix sp.]